MEIAQAQTIAATGAYVPPAVWWTVFLLVGAVFLLYSLILTYHWFSYGMNNTVAVATSIFYYSVSLLLLFVMAASAVALSLS